MEATKEDHRCKLRLWVGHGNEDRIVDCCGVAQSSSPLMSAIGTAGVGKTDTLLRILAQILVPARGATLRQFIINEASASKQIPRPGVTYGVAVFARFNQTTSFNSQHEHVSGAALCNRLLCDYLGVQFDTVEARLFPRRHSSAGGRGDSLARSG